VQIDWSDYFRVHANRRNLLLHLIAVPLFIVSFPCFVIAAVRLDAAMAGIALLTSASALAMQGAGHRLEVCRPLPFAGPGEFLRRWFTEQYVTFPTFVANGSWLRQFRASEVRSDAES
jgi:hypothetical protein